MAVFKSKLSPHSKIRDEYPLLDRLAVSWLSPDKAKVKG